MNLDYEKLEGEAKNELQNYAASLSTLRSEAESLPVTNEQEAGIANELLARVKRFGKGLDEVRKGVTKPIRAAIDTIQEMFNPQIAIAAEVEKILKRKILAFAEEQEKIKVAEERKRREEAATLMKAEQERLEAEALKNNSDKALSAAVAIEQCVKTIEAASVRVDTAVRSSTATSSIRKTWTFEIENEDIVPRDYCTPDSVKIRTAVRAGVRSIPGVKIFESSSITVR